MQKKQLAIMQPEICKKLDKLKSSKVVQEL